MSRSNEILLSLKNLSVGFKADRRQAAILFAGLNLDLAAGELVCLMGPNGVGKSSLIRTIAGLQNPIAGHVLFSGIGLEWSRQLSVVLTDRIADSNFTAWELVSFGRYPYLTWSTQLNEADVQQIDVAISLVQIKSLAQKKVQELSDGQLQMVMIARALAQDTPVILLDEPTAHLDLNNRVEIMRVLKSLTRKTNKAILVSTHELDLALQLADRIWLTDRDQRIITGIPEDLVLEGAFDRIFEFKGFDLKTGRIEHLVTRREKISLEGSGHEYLWTKNALERNGYEVVVTASKNRIRLEHQDSTLSWHLEQGSEPRQTFQALHLLIQHLHQTIA